ncbi:unnamed protein product, partial [Meganyctiphanes norvegica]
MCCDCCLQIELKREFKKENCFLDHPHPKLFLQSEWQHNQDGISTWYLLYRWFWAVWHVGWGIWAMLVEGKYFYLYLTNLTFLMMAICTLTHAVIVTIDFQTYRSTGSLPSRMSVKMKLLWVLQNIIGFPPLFITLAFWTLLYDYDNAQIVFIFFTVLYSVRPSLNSYRMPLRNPSVRFLHFVVPHSQATILVNVLYCFCLMFLISWLRDSSDLFV